MARARIWQLIATVVILGAAGALVTFSPLELKPSDSPEQTLVQHRGGMAYAQMPTLQGGGGYTPPLEDEEQEPVPVEEEAPAKPLSQMTDEEKMKLLEDWKNADPREIIEAKYEDLAQRKTRTTDEESEDFIPDTGRIDPLTRVRSEVPDELKPPRAEEIDANAFEAYIDSRAASQIVESLGFVTEVWQVIHIGLQRLVTISVARDYYDQIGVGEGFSFPYWSETGRLVDVNFVVVKADPDEVTIAVSAQPRGTSINVSKTFNYIPRN